MEPHYLKTHNTRKHKVAKAIPEDLISTLLSSGAVLPTYPLPPTTVVVAYKGLSTTPGFVCPYCSSGFTSPKSLTNHVSDTHQQKMTQKMTALHAAHVQRFTLGNDNRSCFQVHPTESAAVYANMPYLLKIRQELDTRPSLDQLDVRQISPWHVTTRWHEYLSCYQSLDLPAMIQIPPAFEGPFSILPIVKQYYEHAYALIPFTSQLSRQILATENPQE